MLRKASQADAQKAQHAAWLLYNTLEQAKRKDHLTIEQALHSVAYFVSNTLANLLRHADSAAEAEEVFADFVRVVRARTQQLSAELKTRPHDLMR